MAEKKAKHGWDTALYEGRHSFVWESGNELVDLLQPTVGERILDLGCGTGQLTSRIAEAGASVLGVDASPEMIGQARQNFPKLSFSLQDGEKLGFASEFDAVFSNAALHWMLQAGDVAEGIYRALRSGGRFVAEFGGKGNIRRIEDAIRSVVLKQGLPVAPSPWYFPSVSGYSTLLEERGFEVRFARLFDRDTLLAGATGMHDWLDQFGAPYLHGLERPVRSRVVQGVTERLRPHAWNGEAWIADYRRLRIVALKPD
jgi:trans-aconitate methyltransferase